MNKTLYLKQYYLKNKERFIAKVKLWQKENVEKANKKSLKWYYNNLKQAKEARAKWRKEHIGYFKNYYQSHKQQAYKNSMRWRAENKDKVKLYRKTTKLPRRAVGFITKDTIQRIYEDNIKQCGTLTCYLCGNPIKFGDDSIDHKIPISKGGNNDYCNLRVTHIICNKKKGNWH